MSNCREVTFGSRLNFQFFWAQESSGVSQVDTPEDYQTDSQ